MRGLTLGALVCGALVVLTVLNASVARGDSISPNYSRSQAYSGRFGSWTSYGADTTVVAPWSTSSSIALHGGSATATADASAQGGTLAAVFGADATAMRGGTAQTRIRFTAVDDAAYSLSGAYSFSGGRGTAHYRVLLQDLTTGAYLFRNEQYSFDGSPVPVSNQSFTLGGTAGTTGTTTLIGQLSGSLQTGHWYEFYMAAMTVSSGTVPSALTGSAHATITIGSPVPEPTTLALFGLGAGALALRRRKRKLA